MSRPLPAWLADGPQPWRGEEASAFGQGPMIVADAAEAPKLAVLGGELTHTIVVGVDETGNLPDAGDSFDVLLTTAATPPRPWVQVQSVTEASDALTAAVTANPHAAVTLAQVLRAQRSVSFETGLQIESFAYSTLLAGAEFRRWRAAKPLESAPPTTGPAVLVDRDGDLLRITMARPEDENGMTAEMRDALVEALRAARLDESATSVEIRGQGRVFCTGGVFRDFGTAEDLALAHHIRTVRSVALALHQLGERSRVFIHGAAVGSGIEFAAAAQEIVAHPATIFSLPEVSMGLIPGAGGTVTVARRIGWQRTLYMALSGIRLRARTALAWGLVDKLEDA